MSASIDDVAIGWQVYALTHSAFALGLVGLTWFAPQLLLAIPAGVLADRIDRRGICIAVALVNAACSSGYVALAHANVTALAPWFAIFAAQGISFSIGAPSQRSLLPQLVARDAFVRAAAFTSSVAQVVTIAGPALAGLLIVFGVPLAFGAAALMQLISAIGFALLPPQSPLPVDHSQSALRSALGGVRYIFDHPIVLGAISLDLFAVLFGGATALLPVFATEVLNVGATGFGLLRAAPAFGAAIVALLIARRPLRRHGARWLFWCVAGFGAFTIVFGLSRSFVLSLFALAVAGGCDMVSMAIRSVLVQLRTPNAMRGRVSAVENIFIGASNELGAFESGTVAAAIGAVPSVVLGGAATLAVIALWALLFPALRRFDELVSPPPVEN